MRLWDLPSCRAPRFLLAPAIPLFSFTALISNRLPSRRRKTSPGIGSGIFSSARSIAIISNATKVSRCWCSTQDARADITAWPAAGLQTYAPIDFSRAAKIVDGQEITLSFSLAFVSHPAAPWLGLFACQHHTPAYFAQPRYLQHANGATAIQDVWIVGETAPDLAGFMQAVTGAKAISEDPSVTVLQTRIGAIVLARPVAFASAFGLTAPHQDDGPHLAALTVTCQTMGQLADLPKVGDRHVLAPEKNFGTAIGFVTTKR